MDGKLLVLCGERPTIDENGRRIDEKGQLLTKQGNEYRDIEGNVVQVDEHKKSDQRDGFIKPNGNRINKT